MHSKLISSGCVRLVPEYPQCQYNPLLLFKVEQLTHSSRYDLPQTWTPILHPIFDGEQMLQVRRVVCKGVYNHCYNLVLHLRPYRDEPSASRPIRADKHRRGQRVLTWVTSREHCAAAGIFLHPCTRRVWQAAEGELEVSLSFILAPVNFLFLPRPLSACPKLVLCPDSHPDASKDSYTLWEGRKQNEKVKG